MAPQGLATFPGIRSILSASMTFSAGITPSTCTIRFPPGDEITRQVGTLKFTYGSQRIEFPDAGINFNSLRADASGQEWSVQIQDRRWKWQYGHINGAYNLRKSNGKIDIELPEKTPQELARLLLDAMGEYGYSVFHLPNESRPEVVWNYSNPAKELASLCESLGCRVVLGIDDNVNIFVNGQGEQLPSNGRVMNAGLGITAKLKPDKLLLVGGKVLFQTKLLLEAVGEDTDGSIRPIERLSYIPSGGWREADPSYMGIVEKEYTKEGETLYASDLALKSVFRWYRIKSLVPSGLKVPGFSGTVEKIDQLLPLNDHLIDPITVGNEKKKAPAFVVGVYIADEDYTNTPKGTPVLTPFRLNAAKGIVEFSEPVFKRYEKTDDDIAPADLMLTTSYSVQTKERGPHELSTVERKLSGRNNGTGAMVISRPEIFHTHRQVYTDTDTLDDVNTNLDIANKEANKILDAAEKELSTGPSSDVAYAGLEEIELDGAIRQVSWTVGGNGTETRASRNVEHNVYIPSEKKKREREESEKQLARENAEAHSRAIKFFGDDLGAIP